MGSWVVGLIVAYRQRGGREGEKERVREKRERPDRHRLMTGHSLTQRLHSSSFLGLPFRILNMNSKKELLWSLRVGIQVQGPNWADF